MEGDKIAKVGAGGRGKIYDDADARITCPNCSQIKSRKDVSDPRSWSRLGKRVVDKFKDGPVS